MPQVNKFEFHSFWCPVCGNKAFDLPRQRSHFHEKGHRKTLYCPTCRKERQCIECQSDADVYEFKEAYYNGEFENDKRFTQVIATTHCNEFQEVRNYSKYYSDSPFVVKERD